MMLSKSSRDDANSEIALSASIAPFTLQLADATASVNDRKLAERFTRALPPV
jgi:hypothetical protein